MSAASQTLQGRREANLQWERAGLEALGGPPPDVAETVIDIPLSDGWVSRTVLVWPVPKSGASLRCPLIVYYHGGGFMMGSPEQVLLPARGFARHFGAVVACPSYKFCPEDPFPASVQSASDACAWLSEAGHLNDGRLRGTGVTVDPELGFVVGGISAGGNIAVVLPGIQALDPDARAAVTAGLLPMRARITGVFAAIPAVVQEDMLPEPFDSLFTSREENAMGGGGGAEGLTTAAIRNLERLLEADWDSPWWSPLNVDFSDAETQKRHADKVFIQGGEHDPLRDDAIIYDQWLGKVGAAESRLAILDGMGHAAWATPDWPGSKKDDLRTVSLDGMSWLLGREWDKSRDPPY